MSCCQNTTKARCCCGSRESARAVSSEWSLRDHLGEVSVRLGFGRMRYRVDPGLYALGGPGASSAVYVTANYKLSFDHLRRALAGQAAWILVLDTKGVNVWCAAGKGTFSTDELCRSIEAVKLREVVNHRRLVLPQLGAVGVEAQRVAERTGFTVIYGPVRADDIPAWLKNGRRKDEAMRTVRFSLADRLVLAPVELTNARLHLLGLIVLSLAMAWLHQRGFGEGTAVLFCGYALLLVGAVLSGSLLVPALLPWLPTRSFSLKGAVVGVAWVAGLAVIASRNHGRLFWHFVEGGWALSGAFLLAAALVAYLGLNFTGATTFTSQSGTVRETRRALPFIGASAACGLTFQIIAAVGGAS